MDFLRNAWNTVKETASDVGGFLAKYNPITALQQGWAYGQKAGDSINRTVVDTVQRGLSSAGGAIGGTAAKTLWATLLPLIPVIVLGAGAWYFLSRRRGG